MSADRLQELRLKLEEIQTEQQNIVAVADRETRALTDAESARLDELSNAFDTVKAEVGRRDKVVANAVALTQSAGRHVPPEQPAATPSAPAPAAPGQPPVQHINVLDPRHTYHRGTHSFKSLGEQALAIVAAARFPANMDPRLQAFNVSTYQQESVGADGGFAVPPDFRAEILKQVSGEESILGRCTALSTSSNEISFPKDESAPWASSGTVTATWDGEGGNATASKLAFKKHRIPVDKLTTLVYVTDELMSDAPAMDTYLRTKIADVMNYKVGDAIFRGTGVGMPLGILNSSALVSVAKTGSQVADTLTGDNIVGMWARLYAPCRTSAVWFINQDIEPQLMFLMKQIKLDTGAVTTGGAVPLYVPPGGLSGSPYATLMGRPVVPTQLCDTLGDKGDIILADLSKYYAVTKAGEGGPRVDTSIHFAFDQNLTAFRVTFRLGGSPAWSAAITPANSSNTLSSFVTLDARA